MDAATDIADPMDKLYRVALGPVLHDKLPQGDTARYSWLNGSFENVEWKQTAIASAINDGRPITTWHRKHWRNSENYQCGQHIGVDFDTEDRRSTLQALTKDTFIRKYGFLVYTTPSHRPEAPRARVLFLLDTPIMQAANYALASAALLWVFGSADRQCKDPCRFFYGARPGACEMEWIARELPLEVVKHLITEYQKTGLRERKRVSERYQGQTPAEVELIDALKVIDPWGVSYDDWLAVLMAIHSAYPDETGLRIAESWGAGTPGEIERKWRGFKQDGNTQGRTGVGTLFMMAKERGWEKKIVTLDNAAIVGYNRVA